VDEFDTTRLSELASEPYRVHELLLDLIVTRTQLRLELQAIKQAIESRAVKEASGAVEVVSKPAVLLYALPTI
jgi:hypothetical protein